MIYGGGCRVHAFNLTAQGCYAEFEDTRWSLRFGLMCATFSSTRVECELPNPLLLCSLIMPSRD